MKKTTAQFNPESIKELIALRLRISEIYRTGQATPATLNSHIYNRKFALENFLFNIPAGSQFARQQYTL